MKLVRSHSTPPSEGLFGLRPFLRFLVVILVLYLLVIVASILLTSTSITHGVG